ncbi:hypothetical protein HQ520_04580 [bacterium]|nr:hypothetical protein [bacterium]
MAINRKNSRRIVVNGCEFRWRATGNDGWITVVIWPTANMDFRMIASVGYHETYRQRSDISGTATSQIVVTNRIIRKVIESVGIDNALRKKGQLIVGEIEGLFDIKDAVRGIYNQRIHQSPDGAGDP